MVIITKFIFALSFYTGSFRGWVAKSLRLDKQTSSCYSSLKSMQSR